MVEWNIRINRYRIKSGLKTFVLVFGSLMFLMQCGDKSGTDYQIEAVKSQSFPIIDGKLDEAIWQQAKSVVLVENRSGNVVSDSRLKTQVMMCYDISTLYIAFICNDPDIWTNYTKRDEFLWQEEAVEVFIEVDDVPETYVEIEVSPANVVFNHYIVDPENIDFQATARFDLPGIKTAVSVNGTLNKRADTDQSWTVEIGIPFRDLVTERNANVTADTDIRINFFRLDKNMNMNSAGYAWSPTGARFHKPSAFGRLVLK